VSHTLHHPLESTTTNLLLTQSLLEWARTQSLRSFIQVSSGEVYGPTPQPATEALPHRPRSPYAASKAIQEDIARAYRSSYGVPTIIVNTQNVFGEFQPSHKFIPTIARSLKTNTPIPIVVDAQGKAGIRRYLHAEALADALRFVIEQPRQEHYHVAGEEDISHLDLVQRVATMLDRVAIVETTPDARPGHEGTYWLDSSRIRSQGWQEPLPWTKSLEITVEALCR
jgi:dTDP-glucose 4,6-dehydratase